MMERRDIFWPVLLSFNVAISAVYYLQMRGHDPWLFGWPWWMRVPGELAIVGMTILYVWRGRTV